MREVARWAEAPVIKHAMRRGPPCQTLADLMTIREKRGRSTRALKVAVSWAYAPAIASPALRAAGLIMLARASHGLTLAHPPKYH